jgi:hypothetical protein
MFISQIPGGMSGGFPTKSAVFNANSTTGASTVSLAGVVNVIVVCGNERSACVVKRLTFAFPVGEYVTEVAGCIGVPVMAPIPVAPVKVVRGV